MSRYSLKPLPHRSDVFEVAVGWDSNLSTYFAIVFGVPETASEPDVLLWRGRTFGEIHRVAELLDIVLEYAELVGELRGRLDADRSDAPNNKLKQPVELNPLWMFRGNSTGKSRRKPDTRSSGRPGFREPRL